MQAADPGQKMRMDILRRDAERKIFEKLRTHNWSEKIEREFPDGLIISAERGGQASGVVCRRETSTICA